ncbi:MAG: response regulator [Elusimicrobia bacterium]|nr:response regulator [Elusimicrobiota bacterium]
MGSTVMSDAKKVLIVDDEVALTDLVRDVLEEDEFQPLIAHTGREGVDKATHETPDVIILDVDLPDIDGFAVCRELRNHVQLRHTPIIMLTVRSDQRDEITGLQAGADDYLTKPFKVPRLLARIHLAIERTQRELDANPLTHLPGNTAILQTLEQRIRDQTPFAVLYLDLNHFKAYNDRYGFIAGDQVIKATGQVIMEAVNLQNAPNTFVGHVGGDDFVAVVAPEHVQPACEEIIRRFDHLVPLLYSPEDRQRGYIELRDRRGQTSRFPLLSVAIAAVSNQNRPLSHPGEISAIAGELKAMAKSAGKSHYVVDQRRVL